MFLIHFGCDPEWVLNLGMLEFNALAETAMRLHYQQQLNDTYQARLAAQDDGKQFKKHMEGLKRLCQSGSDKPNGDTLKSDLSQLGVMK